MSSRPPKSSPDPDVEALKLAAADLVPVVAPFSTVALVAVLCLRLLDAGFDRLAEAVLLLLAHEFPALERCMRGGLR